MNSNPLIKSLTTEGVNDDLNINNILNYLVLNGDNIIKNIIYNFQKKFSNNFNYNAYKDKNRNGVYFKIILFQNDVDYRIYKYSFHTDTGKFNKFHFSIIHSIDIVDIFVKKTIFNTFQKKEIIPPEYFSKYQIQLQAQSWFDLTTNIVTINEKNVNNKLALDQTDMDIFSICTNCIQNQLDGIHKYYLSQTQLDERYQMLLQGLKYKHSHDRDYLLYRQKSEQYKTNNNKHEEQINMIIKQNLELHKLANLYNQPSVEEYGLPPYKGGNKNKINLKKLTILELKDICKINKIKKYSKLKKDDLIKLIKNYNKVN